MSENLSEFVLYTNSTHPAANQLLDYFFSSIITFQTLIKCSLHLSSYYESYCLTYKCATSKPQVSVIVYFALKWSLERLFMFNKSWKNLMQKTLATKPTNKQTKSPQASSLASPAAMPLNFGPMTQYWKPSNNLNFTVNL